MKCVGALQKTVLGILTEYSYLNAPTHTQSYSILEMRTAHYRI